MSAEIPLENAGNWSLYQTISDIDDSKIAALTILSRDKEGASLLDEKAQLVLRCMNKKDIVMWVELRGEILPVMSDKVEVLSRVGKETAETASWELINHNIVVNPNAVKTINAMREVDKYLVRVTAGKKQHTRIFDIDGLANATGDFLDACEAH